MIIRGIFSSLRKIADSERYQITIFQSLCYFLFFRQVFLNFQKKVRKILSHGLKDSFIETLNIIFSENLLKLNLSNFHPWENWRFSYLRFLPSVIPHFWRLVCNFPFSNISLFYLLNHQSFHKISFENVLFFFQNKY